MGLDEVAEEILSAGRAAAREVIAQAESEAAKITAEARERSSNFPQFSTGGFGVEDRAARVAAHVTDRSM